MNDRTRQRWVQVAPALPVEGTFEYEIPEHLADKVEIGKRVLAPFRARKITGYIVELETEPEIEPSRLKPIIDVLDQEPLFLSEQMPLFRFCADYYQAPLGLVLKTALPPGINIASRRLVRITELGLERKSSLSGPAKILIELLEQLEELPINKIDSLLSEPVSDSLLKSLARKGLIEICDEIEQAKTKPREELCIKLIKLPSQEMELKLSQRAREQYRFFLVLKKTGSVLLPELREQFKNPLMLARGLEKRGLVKLEKVRIERKPFSLELLPSPKPEFLSQAQKQALLRIESAITQNQAKTFLLEGVTGSGKTEVYLQSAQMVLRRGKKVLILVPEISLTPQLIHRFRTRFPEERIAILHSGLSPAERFDQWWQVRRGEVSMVIGARSAIFAPLKNLGLIVVDEEQDSSYKQEFGIHYQARDLAVWRGKNENAVVILGSATPSLESAYNAELGKYERLELPERVDSKPLPDIQIVDLRESIPAEDTESREPEIKSMELSPEKRISAFQIISEPLKSALKDNFRRGNQSIIFLNRRGFAPTLLCLKCGHQFLCPNCSVALTWHKKRTSQQVSSIDEPLPQESYLLCHYCGTYQPVPNYCPDCLSDKVRDFGIGTERLEQELKQILPQARIARMDRDTMSSRRAYFELIQKMEIREIDVLVGTQMVAKGHDLAGVTLVGVILADQSLNIPDFRSAEHTFQIVTQVAGRSGRGEFPGKVIIQSFNPEHYAIKYALTHNFRGFYKEEMALREAFGYPPFTRISLLRISSNKLESAENAVKLLRKLSNTLKSHQGFKEIRTLGPASAPLFRLRGRFRFQQLVFAKNTSVLGKFTKILTENFYAQNKEPVKLDMDRDPVSLL